uniref:Uncharacterized protein n=1 Tax=Romanomermis culicivorax TaxID=13658 RepID=A0A915KFG4_ROMCU
MFTSLEEGPTFVSKELANNPDQGRWPTLLKWYISTFHYEHLPHKRLWPCIQAVESQEQQSVVQ